MKRLFSKIIKKSYRNIGKKIHEFDYDVIVIGGGSGGTSIANNLSKEKKVCILDYVKPSPNTENVWGIGGTCVNVGCIPKKLSHFSHLKNPNDFMESYGYENSIKDSKINKNWELLSNNINMYIKSLNFKTLSKLIQNNVDYKNAYGIFEDKNTIILQDGETEEKITADKIIIATGLRPIIPKIEGHEHIITSDDLFSDSKDPGKCLIVGGSYVALECAGIIEDSTVMVRSKLLRGFDDDCSNFIYNDMNNFCNVNFYFDSIPTKIKKINEHEYEVTYKNLKNNENFMTENFNTILYAIGRESKILDMNIDAIGIEIDEENKIIVDENLKTNIDNIFAIGDINNSGDLLTTVAKIQADHVSSLILNENYDEIIDYENTPKTVFTPLEYGSIGLSENEAILKYGEENIEIYHQKINLLEYMMIPKYFDRKGYIKVICDKKNEEKIIGFHFISPGSGELTQVMAMAMKIGINKKDLDKTIGIHPTYAEKLTTLKKGVFDDEGC